MACQFMVRGGYTNARLGTYEGILLYTNEEFTIRKKKDTRETWEECRENESKKPQGGKLGFIWYCGFCHEKVGKFSQVRITGNIPTILN